MILLEIETITGHAVEMTGGNFIHDSCAINLYIRYTNNAGKETVVQCICQLLESDSILTFMVLSLRTALKQIKKELGVE
jgi:hypothetical protein